MRAWLANAAMLVVGVVATPAAAQSRPVGGRPAPVTTLERRAGLRAGVSLAGTAGVGVAARLGYQVDATIGVYGEAAFTALLPSQVLAVSSAVALQVNIGSYFFVAYGPALTVAGGRPIRTLPCPPPPGMCPPQGYVWEPMPTVFARVGVEVPLRGRTGRTHGALSIALAGRVALSAQNGMVLPVPALEIGYETY